MEHHYIINNAKDAPEKITALWEAIYTVYYCYYFCPNTMMAYYIIVMPID